uniref:TPT domain-containing protein n=1 Tax=Globodera pallida TaxID=36090 RepID=A0A183CGI7_GLOPA
MEWSVKPDKTTDHKEFDHGTKAVHLSNYLYSGPVKEFVLLRPFIALPVKLATTNIIAFFKIYTGIDPGPFIVDAATVSISRVLYQSWQKEFTTLFIFTWSHCLCNNFGGIGILSVCNRINPRSTKICLGSNLAKSCIAQTQLPFIFL